MMEDNAFTFDELVFASLVLAAVTTSVFRDSFYDLVDIPHLTPVEMILFSIIGVCGSFVVYVVVFVMDADPAGEQIHSGADNVDDTDEARGEQEW